MKQYTSALFLLLCVAACKKYDLAPEIQDPAYIRVFNDLSGTTDALHTQQASNFLTFLLDPETDAGGVPTNASTIGDYLAPRLQFALSYSANEGNRSIGDGYLGGNVRYDLPSEVVLTPTNYEYPGNKHVLAAPVINGFDLSGWAQTPSGKHRIVFVQRPQNDVDFKNLSTDIRKRILLDTTVNFEKGEVYTIEVVSRDLDKGQYGLYVRKEQFTHMAVDTSKLYLGFVNLSGKATREDSAGFSTVFPDRIKVNASYLIYNDAASGGYNKFYNPYPGYNNTYLTSMLTTMDTSISFIPLPMLPQDTFFYQGLVRTYWTPTPAISTDFGSLPHFEFNMTDADAPGAGSFPIKSIIDPAVMNNYQNGLLSTYTPNLNLLVNNNGVYHVYPTVNIMELVYNRVYMIQMVRAIN